jgi:hypothetical protein
MKIIILLIFSLLSSLSFFLFSHFFQKEKKIKKLRSKFKEIENITFALFKYIIFYSAVLIIFNSFIFTLLSFSLQNFYIRIPIVKLQIPWQWFFPILCFIFAYSLKEIIEIL